MNWLVDIGLFALVGIYAVTSASSIIWTAKRTSCRKVMKKTAEMLMPK